MAEMKIERFEAFNGFTWYRIFSDYAKDSLALEPKELMALLTYLQEHEHEIIQDTLSNRVSDEMKGM